MHVSIPSLVTLLALTGSALAANAAGEKKPNVLIIMSDDQDRLLGSMDYMPVVQKMMGDGVEFENHYGTISNCCPSRATFLRGQAAHSTNITHVRPPGGNYDKWRLAGEDKNYLPHWIKKAGYKAEYVGKFLNGYSQANYHIPPKGWDHVDALIEPYINDYSNVVMSQNGERPVQYRGFHSNDVVRIKAIDRLQRLLDAEEPFFLAIMPYAPHVAGRQPPTPQARHADKFADATAPRFANWNPSDEIQKTKSVFLKDLKLMDSEAEASADRLFRGRIRAIQGVDEIIEDVLAKLEEKGQLDNTYVIFTTDNGYHIGAHRLPGGKALPYIQETNLPLVVRGPGIPGGAFPKVHFGKCMQYQDEANEQPFWPVGAENDLGKAYRQPTDNWVSSDKGKPGVPPNAELAGGPEQRHATMEQLMADIHVLTDEETGPLVPAEED
ncbi:alkaline-phosphatase-like protein [Apiospora saccharicola]